MIRVGNPLDFYMKGHFIVTFIQDKWRITPKVTLNYGLRWDAQLMPETVDPKTTAYAAFLNDPNFPSDGTIPDQWKQFQPRLGVAWDVKGDGKSVLRANGGIYYARQNMLTQVGSVTTNGLQQQTLYRDSSFTQFADMPVWPSLLTPTPLPPGEFPLFSGVRMFAKDYRNPRGAFADAFHAGDWGYLTGLWHIL